jgi:hypothetical protein
MNLEMDLLFGNEPVTSSCMMDTPAVGYFDQKNSAKSDDSLAGDHFALGYIASD